MNIDSQFFKKRFSKLVSEMNKHDIWMLASSLAFNLVLAVAPFLILLLIGATLLPAFYKSLVVAESQSIFGPEAGTFMGLIVRGAEKNQYYNGISGYISLLIIVISASSIFSQLKYGMDKINDTESTPQPWSFLVFVKERIAFLFFLFGMVVLMLTSLVVSTFVNGFMEGRQALVYLAFSFLLTVALQTLVFAGIFRFIPTERFSWARSFVSGFIAALFFAVGKELVSLYLGKSAVASIYGAAGSAIIFLLWLYYCSLTFYMSHEFTNNFLFTEKTR
jgi:membrane protein